MPSGKVHLAFELATLPLWTTAGVFLGVGWDEIVVFTAAYAGASLLLSPDLDLAESVVTRRWGPLRILWWPYTAAFKHRGLSHSIVFGPLTRVLYLGFLAACVWAALYLGLGLRVGWQLPPPGSVLAFFTGIYLTNLLHVVLDRLGSALGRAGGRS
ncbi:DUF2227 family putative metal-binding protein [Candidatus Bipolaricaulota sp. J31]